AQEIEIQGAPPTADYGTSFTVTVPGGGSGNPVVVSASGACTIAGGRVTMTRGTGTCTLRATQAGNANYAEGVAVRTVDARRAEPVIAWSALEPIVYGTPLGPAQLNAVLAS